MAGGSNNIARMSPRQRMINLMYIVLTAMLALNVSSDVLNGFSQVQASLQKTTDSMSAKNASQFRYLQQLAQEYPEQVAPFLKTGEQIKARTAALYSEIEKIKVMIAREADGDGADYKSLLNKDDLEASSAVLLDPLTERGKALRLKIDEYRKYILSIISDPDKRKAVDELLSTASPNVKGTVGPTSWEQRNFEGMPVIASITYLTHIQSNLRQAESDAYSSVINAISTETGIDVGEMKVSSLSAYVIPRSTMVMSGGQYEADIVLAAVDTASMPRVYVGGRLVPDGKLRLGASGLGNHEYSGYIEVLKADGSTGKYPFKSTYTVIEPMATISPTMMNVLYAGIDNPISISAPGVPMGAINATITAGSLTRKGDQWTARCSAVGSTVDIKVSATLEGRAVSLGSMTFRVRKLPDPLPYIGIKDSNGNTVRYKGTPKRISKAALMGAHGIGAALDDGILDINYSVVSFSTVFFDSMGNAIPENSNGSAFSARQVEQFKRLKPGKSFFITGIKAHGPDGITRDIPPMEVALN